MNPDTTIPIPEWPPTQRGLSPSKHAQILRYLLLEWRPGAIAEECGVCQCVVYKMKENLMRYSSIRQSQYQSLSRPSKLSEADKNALLESLLHEEWRYQDKMVYWL